MPAAPEQVADSWGLAVRLARREARSGFAGFRIFLLCLALGVAAMAAVGLMESSFKAGLVAEGRAILGGDVELTLVQREASERQIAYLRQRGRLAQIATLRAMTRPAKGGDAVLAELKTIDQAYPLFGDVVFVQENFTVSGLFDGDVIAADQVLLARLGLAVGDQIAIGEAVFTLGAAIKREPDRLTTGLTLGPRVLLSRQSLAKTGLVQPGSLVRWRYRLRLPETTNDDAALKAFRANVDQAFPDAGWRIRDRGNAAPRIERLVERLAMLLSFIALTALVIGGVGIATAAKTYLDGRVRTIAILKCLGAPGGLIFKTYLLHLLRLVLLGSVAGLVLGLALTLAAGPVLQQFVPLPARFGFYLQPLAVAVLFGLVITLMFALWSLGAARAVPAAALFRAQVASLPAWPALRYIAATLVLFAGLAGLTFLSVTNARFAMFYVGGVVGSFLVFWAAARLIVWLARRVSQPRLRLLRLALIQLRAAGVTTVATVISLGLGLTLLVALVLIEGNFVRHLLQQLPNSAPSFYFVDIQPGQAKAFDAVVAQTKGVTASERVPMLRGRITKLKGIDAGEFSPPPSARWVLRGDRGLTYAREKPGKVTLTQGKWWPRDYAGPPLVSFADELGRGLGLKLGDEITVNVLGRELTATIANFRHVEWGGLGINFVMVFSPDPIARAPHAVLATVTMPERGELALMRAVSEKFPNITMVRVREVLQSINDLMEKLLFAARAAAGLAIFVGIIVLIGALAASRHARRYDAVVLKTLGLTRPELMRVYMLEHGLLGLATGLIAALCGAVIAYGLLEFVFRVGWVFMPGTVAATIIGAGLVTVVFGLAGTWRVLGVRPARLLHQE